ncbi:universal stress protein UspA [Prosthecochloris sp. GSB1]|uniref:universal stress protein n=1 Tax=Prosthecochloris sp. GSB1 TaxID=281093 RepID=UPI000B8D1290|nr:universal stress protein [Prosthecochloris sp. GSB1]ASQ90725.1 universal stress protein UspA [Prosthecochloris sp. GSB1]
MIPLTSILYAASGNDERKSGGLRQALRLCRDSNTPLTVVQICPDVPEKHAPLQNRFMDFLEDELHDSLASVRKELDIPEQTVRARIVVRQQAGTPPAISLIRMVIDEEYGLLVKDAEAVEGGRGFKGTDMTLLRKCPCPVWLARNTAHAGPPVRLAVAIDPESREPGERELSLNLLRTAGSLARGFEGELSVVSCWEYEFERFLRYKSWVNISEEELRMNAEDIRKDLLGEIERLVHESEIAVDRRIHHMRGRPEDLIPEFTEQHKTDLLIMGTLARTGIPGFLIGNTAENILEKTSCSLLALKPEGFVSPVRPE